MFVFIKIYILCLLTVINYGETFEEAFLKHPENFLTQSEEQFKKFQEIIKEAQNICHKTQQVTEEIEDAVEHLPGLLEDFRKHLILLLAKMQEIIENPGKIITEKFEQFINKLEGTMREMQEYLAKLFNIVNHSKDILQDMKNNKYLVKEPGKLEEIQGIADKSTEPTEHPLEANSKPTVKPTTKPNTPVCDCETCSCEKSCKSYKGHQFPSIPCPTRTVCCIKKYHSYNFLGSSGYFQYSGEEWDDVLQTALDYLKNMLKL